MSINKIKLGMWDKWRVCKEKTSIYVKQKIRKKLLNSKGQPPGDTVILYLGKTNPKKNWQTSVYHWTKPLYPWQYRKSTLLGNKTRNARKWTSEVWSKSNAATLWSFFVTTSLKAVFSSVQSSVVSDSLRRPQTGARQASPSITDSRSLPKLNSIESMMPSNHLSVVPFSLLQSFQALNIHKVRGVVSKQLPSRSWPPGRVNKQEFKT